MEEALEMARAKDTKQRMAGVERLHHLLEVSNKGLSPAETTAPVDCCLDLLKDNSNFRVSQGALQALSAAAVLASEHFKLHFNALVPAVVERLGGSKQPVRDAARRLLLTLMELCMVAKSWRVREEFVRTMTSAIGLFASTELPLQRVLLPPTVVFCLVDIYILLGKAFLPYLERLSSTQLRLVTIYANRISQARSGTKIDDNDG